MITDTGIDPIINAKKILEGHTYDKIIATGYGRYLAQGNFDCKAITEIKAYAVGANYLFPECQTIIDIGGQDSKIIRTHREKVQNFEMNDRCAAGTGRFLEIMATTLGFTIDKFGEEAIKAKDSVAISSMCTVFAESEVISLIACGKSPKCIARGLHESVVNRIFSMISRIGFQDEIVFAGGVAKNPCMVSLLEKRFGSKIQVPKEPQIVGAIGAALAAQKGNQKEER